MREKDFSPMLSDLLKVKEPKWRDYKNFINSKSTNLEFMVNQSEIGLKITSVLSAKKMFDKLTKNLKSFF